MEIMMKKLPVELLNELLICHPEAGLLIWRVRAFHHFTEVHVWKTWNIRYAGNPALNCINGTGYKAGTIKGLRVPAHRVIWAMTFGAWPTEDIDHINGVRSDNRISNLRSVSRLENSKNRVAQESKSKIPGVMWVERKKKWRARITVNGKRVDLGLHSTLDEAAIARKTAERHYGFHPNHGRATN
jgi:hypothetical protein